jgi:hypothetical protein
LRVITSGYAIGWRWLADHPAAALRLAGRKLELFWRGAAMGFSGYGAPIGIAGTRRPVDLAAAEGGALAVLWRLLVLAASGCGAAAAWRRVELVPWLLFLASKLAVTLAFFGYVRQGAAVAPVVWLLVALAVDRFWPGRAAGDPLWRRRGAMALVVLALGVEAWRSTHPPTLLLDGAPLRATDPFPPGDFAPHVVSVR